MTQDVTIQAPCLTSISAVEEATIMDIRQRGAYDLLGAGLTRRKGRAGVGLEERAIRRIDGSYDRRQRADGAEADWDKDHCRRRRYDVFAYL